MAQNIRVYKLITGEEIIGNDVTIYDTFYERIVMERVRIVSMVQTGPQTVGVGMVPYSASNVDGEIRFKLDAIIGEIEPGKDIEDAYLQQTSGIQIANAPGGALKR